MLSQDFIKSVQKKTEVKVMPTLVESIIERKTESKPALNFDFASDIKALLSGSFLGKVKDPVKPTKASIEKERLLQDVLQRRIERDTANTAIEMAERIGATGMLFNDDHLNEIRKNCFDDCQFEDSLSAIEKDIFSSLIEGVSLSEDPDGYTVLYSVDDFVLGAEYEKENNKLVIGEIIYNGDKTIEDEHAHVFLFRNLEESFVDVISVVKPSSIVTLEQKEIEILNNYIEYISNKLKAKRESLESPAEQIAVSSDTYDLTEAGAIDFINSNKDMLQYILVQGSKIQSISNAFKLAISEGLSELVEKVEEVKEEPKDTRSEFIKKERKARTIKK